jgi:SAM-dependent methyltransferase
VLDLGDMPLSDGLLDADQLDRPEPRYPLELAFCPACTLVQLIETVPPEELFAADYPYYSSFSDTLLEHSRRHALDLIAERRLGPDSLVVEVASNDGYLLQTFVERGIPVLGIDPAPGPAAAARERGVPTREAFFGLELARRIAGEGPHADVVIANNVLAHVADTNGFVAGLATLLADDGIAVLEFPYLRDLIDHVEFDTIYHEHLCYFSVHAVVDLFGRHGLTVTDVRRLPIHGGSLRIRVARGDVPGGAVRRLLEEERALGMTGEGYYRDFAARVERLRAELRELLERLKADGASVAGYGAAAKGTILLNSVGADADTIDFVVDRNVHKQGRWMPGVRVPILAPEALLERRPDYTLILPWNFTDEIVSQQRRYLDAGGAFIVPIPRIRLIGDDAAIPVEEVAP